MRRGRRGLDRGRGCRNDFQLTSKEIQPNVSGNGEVKGERLKNGRGGAEEGGFQGVLQANVGPLQSTVNAQGLAG